MSVHCAARTCIALLSVFASLSATCVYAQETSTLLAAVRAEERALRARVGVAVYDADSGRTVHYRGRERFPLNSTHKAFSCAALLAKVDAQAIALDQPVSISREMLVVYSPITEKSLAPQTMTLRETCRAAVSYSDNTAGNVILDAIGGTAGFNAYLRSLGDEQTRLDRREPELNASVPGDLRDTTTPLAIVDALRQVLLGDGLSEASRGELRQWMLDDRVGGALLRASMPSGWTIADKTGAGSHGSRSIIAVIWPPARRPLVIGIYITQTEASMTASNQAIARIGGVLSEVYGHRR